MKHFFLIFAAVIAFNFSSQVQRVVEGKSIIRENIIANSEFNFFRDWTVESTFKSGIGEVVSIFPVVFSTADNKIVLHGLQLDAFVKNQISVLTPPTVGLPNVANKADFFARSIFIDKDEVKKLINYIERDIIPNIESSYKKQSKEYIFKSKEMFMSFLVKEKKQRITMHIVDYGPLGNGIGGGSEIEFWTESQVETIPAFLSAIKDAYAKMK
jgi:hypothetical protein